MTIELKVPTATQAIIDISSKKQDQIREVSIQIATGDKHQDFQGLASEGNAERFLSLSSTITSSETYIKSNEIILARSRTMEQALAQVIDVASEVADTIAQRNNSASGGEIPINVLAESFLENIATALNTRSDGRYLFAGTKTDTKPVENLQSSNINSDGISANAIYYRGNSDVVSIKLSQSQELSYGVNANNEAFQNLIGSVHLLMEGHNNDDKDILADATDMINNAVEQLVSIAASTRAATNTILQSTAVHTDVAQLAYENFVDVSAVNVAEATTRMAELEATIQATYLAFNRLSGLRLSNFLN